jgi:hypothetical protein
MAWMPPLDSPSWRSKTSVAESGGALPCTKQLTLWPRHCGSVMRWRGRSWPWVAVYAIGTPPTLRAVANKTARGHLGIATLWRDVRGSGAPGGVELRQVGPRHGRRCCEDRSEYDGNTGRTGAGMEPLGASSFELARRDWAPACGFTIKAGEAGRFATTGRIDDCIRGHSQKMPGNTLQEGGRP